jgi:phosphoenolpyruvate-protein kinase (PTS system EI component)
MSLVGRSASPGVAYGPFSLGSAAIDELPDRPLQEDEVQGELDRLESAGRAARVSLLRQREALANRFTPEEQRIFDAQVLLLSDPVLEADVRDRIANQRMSLEGAVKDVLSVYERLFEVVESQNLRNRMSDLRDVAMRLLRHCRRSSPRPARIEVEGGVLVVRELTLSDLTEALEHGIAAIVAEGGSLTSHGAILTRAAGIPAVIGVGELRSRLSPDDMLLVDGEAGQVVANPGPELVTGAQGRLAGAAELAPLEQPVLKDGTSIALLAAVASPSEARSASAQGIDEVGLYRTELPVIQRKGAPREASLAALYRQVVNGADRVNFRLPDLDSFTGLADLYPDPESNPAMGMRGMRLLRERPEILSRQIRAILRASEGRPVCIAAPFVSDLSDLRVLRDAVDTAREELRMEGADVSHPVQRGAVIEIPAAALLGREIVAQSDFLLLGLDTLAQNMLAADRRNASGSVSRLLDRPHPVILRAVRKLVQVCDGQGKELTVYGESIAQGAMLPLLVGVGVRRLAVRPTLLAEVHGRLGPLDLDTCERVAEAACHAATPEELEEALPASWRQPGLPGGPA